MLPGKKYKPEDFVAIAWARRWFIVVPFILMAAGAVVYAQIQPNRYRAQTQILVVPQQVPADYVESTVTTMLGERLSMIRQEILSRTQLERIIAEFDLYPRERASMIMEEVIERMRGDIAVNIPPQRSRNANSSSFILAYESENARTALLVTERLASLFIRENVQGRAVTADRTTQFLDAQLEEARRRLMDHEKRLEEYKLKNSGSLPSQVSSNLQAIQTGQLQLQSLIDATARDRDQRLALDRALASETEAASAPVAPSDPAAPAPDAPAVVRLEAARNYLRGLELRLKPEHPDVVRARRIIRDLEKEAEAAALEQPVSSGSVPTRSSSPAEQNRQRRIAAIKTEMESIDRRIAARQREEGRIRTLLDGYQARLEAAPARESELVELTRDYDTIRTSYTELLKKSEASKLALNMERGQIGELFKIVDGARLPERPFSPNRPRIMALGAMLGLGLGLALVGLLEYRDSTFKTDDDVMLALSLPVLAMIPAMVTRAESETRVRRRRLVAITSVCAVVVTGGLLVWKLRLLESWLG